MDIETIWQQRGKEDDALNKFLSTVDVEKLHSRLPLKKLRYNLLIGIVFALLITCVYVVCLYYVSIWQVNLALGVLIAFNSLIMVQTWNLYRRVPSAVTPSNSLKQELTEHYTSLQQWWSVQQKISLFVYPIAVAGGFILGGSLGSGKPVELFLYNSSMLMILAITVLIVVPLCYFGARWMFNFTYGKHFKQLKTTIEELD